MEVPTDQVLCKSIGISNLHCALHTYTNVSIFKRPMWSLVLEYCGP